METKTKQELNRKANRFVEKAEQIRDAIENEEYQYAEELMNEVEYVTHGTEGIKWAIKHASNQEAN